VVRKATQAGVDSAIVVVLDELHAGVIELEFVSTVRFEGVSHGGFAKDASPKRPSRSRLYEDTQDEQADRQHGRRIKHCSPDPHEHHLKL